MGRFDGFEISIAESLNGVLGEKRSNPSHIKDRFFDIANDFRPHSTIPDLEMKLKPKNCFRSCILRDFSFRHYDIMTA